MPAHSTYEAQAQTPLEAPREPRRDRELADGTEAPILLGTADGPAARLLPTGVAGERTLPIYRATGGCRPHIHCRYLAPPPSPGGTPLLGAVAPTSLRSRAAMRLHFVALYVYTFALRSGFDAKLLGRDRGSMGLGRGRNEGAPTLLKNLDPEPYVPDTMTWSSLATAYTA